MNLWVIAFPCLMYLSSVGTCIGSYNSVVTLLADDITIAMGVMFIYQTSQPNSSIWNSIAINFGLPYFSISISLNVLLTLMIVIRLALHSRNIRAAMGAPAGLSGLYKAIVTMLIESSALYAVNSLLFIGPWGAGNHAADIFLPILAETQVRILIQRPLPDRLSNMIYGLAGDRTTAHHSTSRRPERVDEHHYRLQEYCISQHDGEPREDNKW